MQSIIVDSIMIIVIVVLTELDKTCASVPTSEENQCDNLSNFLNFSWWYNIALNNGKI